MHVARQTLTEPRARARDKVSNGTRLLPKTVGIDMRSSAGRRFRHLVATYSAELGSELTESQRTLVRQVSSLQIRIEQLQASIVAGADVRADEIIRLNSEHRRLMATLRGKPSKHADPDVLTAFLAEKYGVDESEPEAEG